jgi:hypothetical protein
MRISEYNEGDLVEFAGNKAIVREVHEDNYFFNSEHIYYTYDIEFTENGAIQKGVNEPALKLISKAKTTNRDKLCECGAWATGSNKDEHSRWCPAYGLEPLKENK